MQAPHATGACAAGAASPHPPTPWCRFCVVMVYERMEESLAYLNYVTGWLPAPLPASNIRNSSLLERQMPPDVLVELERLVSLDRELYVYANARLDRQIAAMRGQPRAWL
jgi:hypothetical protein